jgi:hypothetical protein
MVGGTVARPSANSEAAAPNSDCIDFKRHWRAWVSTRDEHASRAVVYDLFVRVAHDIPFLLNECKRAGGEVAEFILAPDDF